MGHFSLSTSHSLTCQINPNQANSSRGFTTLKPKLFCKRARSCKYGVFQIVRESDKGTAVSKTLKGFKVVTRPSILLAPRHTAPYCTILHRMAGYCTHSFPLHHSATWRTSKLVRPVPEQRFRTSAAIWGSISHAITRLQPRSQVNRAVRDSACPLFRLAWLSWLCFTLDSLDFSYFTSWRESGSPPRWSNMHWRNIEEIQERAWHPCCTLWVTMHFQERLFRLSNFRSIWPSSCLPQSESLFLGHPNQTIVWDH